jgi:hypothetical protein
MLEPLAFVLFQLFRTGKTSTIVGIISSVEKGVIACAVSNAAVANLALKLFSTNLFELQDLLVWGENCDESVRFLNPYCRSDRYQGFFRHYISLRDDSEREKKLKEFAAWLRLDVDNVSLRKIDALCRSVQDDSAIQKFVASAKVVLCTLNTAGSARLRNATQHKFDLLILDEAGQCTEAEFYVSARKKRVCANPTPLHSNKPVPLADRYNFSGCEAHRGFGGSVPITFDCNQ